MSVPVWVLLAFAGWTLLVLLGTIGLYRWSRILGGRAQLTDFPADTPHGEDWYRRAMRAHANCVENLPVYGAIVVAIVATGVQAPALDFLAVVVILARIGQTVTHVAFPQTNLAVGVRFTFFALQLASMVGMGGIVALRA